MCFFSCLFKKYFNSYQQHNKFDIGSRPRADSLFIRHPNNNWYFHVSQHFRARDLSMPLYLSNDVQHFNGRSSAENNSDERKSNCRQNLFIVITTKLISAPDERQSSVTMGILRTCVIIGTLFALVGSDLFKVFFITVKFLKREF